MMNLSGLAILWTFAAKQQNATANGAGVDLQPYANPGKKQLKAALSVGAKSGTSPTLDVKMQDSDDNSTFADISGATFTQATDVTSEEIHFQTNKRYVRAVATLGGTSPTFDMAVGVVAEKRLA